jgi:hypothetical protein
VRCRGQSAALVHISSLQFAPLCIKTDGYGLARRAKCIQCWAYPSQQIAIKRKIKSAKGWAFEGVEGGKVGGEKHGMYRREVHHFVHVDGREFIGTQFEFHKACGMHKPAACKLARGEAKVWNGWHLKGVQLPTQGRGKRWASARPEPSAT